MNDETCRADIWLWRARFFKTRALSSGFIEGGTIRLQRFGQMTRLTKAGFSLRAGDRLIFAIGTRLFDLTIMDTGERRGPASEAQMLYNLNNQPPT
ncbi:MAG: RNA-binding S4 domain-containing protein [Asticcacaulis sp.]